MVSLLPLLCFGLALILLVADLLQPIHGLAVKRFLNGDMSHGGGWRGAVPVLLPGREPDHVAGPDLLDRPAPALRAAAAGRHDQGLPQGVGVPCGPGPRLERDARAGHTRRIGRLEQRVDAYGAREILAGPFAGGL